ncbi:MAG TPA: hypothetical protein PKK05_24695, partial [Leptospiraceae bacterium]|nr:hypothetical protein [Leptospiraceae bacterium]
ATQATSGLSEFIGGGFFNPLLDKIEAMNRAWSGLRKGINKVRLAYSGLNDKGEPIEKESETVGSLPTDKPKPKPHPKPHPKPNNPDNPDNNSNTPPQKGRMAAAALAAAGGIAGAAAKALGGIMQIVSDIGQQHTQAMMSQQGTIGATKGYVGGGGAYFANAQVAQAQIAKARAGRVYGNEAKVSGNEMRFAAQQNMGLSQFVEALGDIKDQDEKVSINFLRGAANITKMTGLKQGVFVQQLQQYSNQLRGQGYLGGLGGVMGLGAGLAQNIPGMKGERAMKVAQGMDTDVRKGAEGSSLSQMAIAAVMKKHNMGYFEAAELFEEQGMGSDKVRGAFGESMEQFSPEVRGEIMRSMGLTRREGRLATAKSLNAPITADTSPIIAGGNKAQALENQKNEMFANSKAAAQAAEIAYKAAQKSMEMFENPTTQKAMLSVVETLQKIENSLFKAVDAITSMANRGVGWITQ